MIENTRGMARLLAHAPKQQDDMVEYRGAQFVCDKPYLIREPNEDYIKRELEWYNSMSLYVDDIPGVTPAIWKSVASYSGRINSNYGWCVYSGNNYDQYAHVEKELIHNPSSRRAVMYYSRPRMHTDAVEDGMDDHMCTTHVQYFIRDNRLECHVYMRSNDAVFGFNNDYAWQRHVQIRLCNSLLTTNSFSDLKPSPIVWNVGSLHVYPRHTHLLEDYK